MSNDRSTGLEIETAHLLDDEPELLLGLSQGEFFSLLAGSFLFWLVIIAIITLTFIDKLLIALTVPFAVALMLMIPTFIFAAKKLAKKKRGMPNGYFSLKIKLAMDTFRRFIGIKTKFNRFTGTWSKSRSA